MYIELLVIVSVLSFFSYWEKVWMFLIKNKKYVSGILYFLSILSFLYLTSNDHHVIKETWEYSLDLLWFILFLPILYKVFNSSLAWKLMLFRKELWILMWILAIIHSLKYFLDPFPIWFWESSFWYFNWEITHMSWWFLALIITIVLTITSNNYCIKKICKFWKPLHRTTYVLLILTLLHVIFLEIWSKNWNEVYFETLIPLFLYILWKILEWSNVKFKLMK